MRNRYTTFVFDCDGVVLNSNPIKTEAFAKIAAPYGQDASEALVAHHLRNGGVSRFEKFRYFQTEILGRPQDASEVEQLCDAYGSQVSLALLACEVAPGLRQLRRAMPDTRWMVISGGAEVELNHVFAERGLLELFDGGVYGSPSSKDSIFERELESGRLRRPAAYFGDSEYDHKAAVGAGLHFLFVSGWSEFRNWREYCANYGITSCRSLAEALTLASGLGLGSEESEEDA